jgi:hypothetical protein
MVLGENNAAFAECQNGIQAFDINSGALQFATDATTVFAATSGGGFVGGGSGGGSIARYDSSGNASFDATQAPIGSLVASNGFMSNSPAGDSLVVSGATVKVPAKSPGAVRPPDRAFANITVPLKSFQVDGTTITQPIGTQVLKAIQTWETKVPGLILEDDGVATTPICVPNTQTWCNDSQTHLDNYISPDNCVPTTGWIALTIRFPNAPTLTNGAPNQGAQVLFTNSITFSPGSLLSSPLEIVPFYDPVICASADATQPPYIRKAAGNMIVMSNQTQESVLAHGLGHVFGLGDLQGPLAGAPPGEGTSNLMCSGDAVRCKSDNGSNFPGNYLNYQQTISARKYLVRWARQ